MKLLMLTKYNTLKNNYELLLENKEEIRLEKIQNQKFRIVTQFSLKDRQI